MIMIGDMCHPITLERNQPTTGPNNEPLDNWVKYADLVAAKRPRTGMERFLDQVQEVARNSTVFTIWKDPAINEAEFRLIYEGWIYDIERIDGLGSIELMLDITATRSDNKQT